MALLFVRNSNDIFLLVMSALNKRRFKSTLKGEFLKNKWLGNIFLQLKEEKSYICIDEKHI
jgi:hypothetical protein